MLRSSMEWLSSREAQRWLASVRLAERALAQCLGARASVWLSRSVALSFALTLVWFVRDMADLLDSILRIALIALSWCAGLAAFSAAGPAPERSLSAAQGLYRSRGFSLDTARRERVFATAWWIARQTGALALLLVILSAGLAPDRGSALHLLALVFGVAVYVLALAFGLALLAHACVSLSAERGQALFIALIWLPETLSVAYPELTGVVSTYGHLLQRCLGAGVGA
jgi:hypothetical protein